MATLRNISSLLAFLAMLALSACATSTTTMGDKSLAVAQTDVAALTRAVIALGPQVDPEEAARLARISYYYALQLRQEYGVTDPPLIHNTKVNMGRRPRGLCYQWADDIEERLRRENFQTLDFHRAIANSDNIRIEHSTPIVSAKGKGMYDGVVIDGWRNGGRLFWSPTLEDTRYHWIAREKVFERKFGPAPAS